MIAESKKKKTNDIIDIDLSSTQRKRFRINGDDSKILELNISDLNIFTRLQEVFPKLDKLAHDAIEKLPSDTDDESNFDAAVSVLKDIDTKMREYLDYIFNSNVSEMCAPDGSLYDPINGQLRFEHILETLSVLYENNFNAEVQKMTRRMNKYTAKYTKK